ncbi:MAG: hypothetical protein JW955_07590 [Sedimentisphaerales bacterium]|nr:hypothetical protein [Sedimentisphaerales bacterium]
MSGGPIQFICCVCLTLLRMNSTVEAVEFAGGSGTPADPYQIATAEQLISIGSDPNLLDKHFVLLNDIDLDPNLPGGRVFTTAVIAPREEAPFREFPNWKGVPFTGTFNGQGHSVKNLTVPMTMNSFIALFGNIAKGGLVSDLRVEDGSLDWQGTAQHGVLAAWNEGRIIRCGATGSVKANMFGGILAGFNRGEIIECWAEGKASGPDSIGGLVGFNSFGIIVNCHTSCRVYITDGREFNWGGGLVGQGCEDVIVNCWASGDVSGVRASRVLGGLVGGSINTLIANCYATGNVSVGRLGRSVGGLVGSGGTICDCYATGSVSGGDSLGGLVGGSAFITDSYAIGHVSLEQGSENVGGLTGTPSQDYVKGCFWNIETSGLTVSGGGTGLTTPQMQDAATYLAAGWDLAGERANGTADIWYIPEGGGAPLLTVHSATFEPHKLDGAGTSEDPYKIATIEDLDAINHHDLAACYRLEADINLAQSPRRKPLIRYFDGKFDGAGRVIAGLTIRGRAHLGLFGDLGACACVTNLSICDANVTGNRSLGLLAGTNRGNITGCRVDGTVSGDSALGILTGWNDGSISDSYGVGSVSSTFNPIGGLTGWNAGLISRCYANASVTWSRTDVSPKEESGGLVGANHEPGWSGVAFTKGLASTDINGEIRACYFLIDADGGGPDNGLGVALTSAQMKQQASFVGWDFENIWTIAEGESYPRLRWEPVP